jgi:galactokinase
MTGGGFGGGVMAQLPATLVNDVCTLVQRASPKSTGLQPDIFVCEASQDAPQLCPSAL